MRYIIANLVNVTTVRLQFLCSIIRESESFMKRLNIFAIRLLLLLLLLLVFSPWACMGRDQSSVRRLVCLWYAASWASSYG